MDGGQASHEPQPDGMTSRVKEQYRCSGNLRARIGLHRRFGTNPIGWQSWVFAQFAIPEGGMVLELGCGVGDLWIENLDRLPRCRVTLSDLSPGMVRESRDKLVGRGRRFGFLVADAQAIPFRNSCLDVVVANHMLYHVPSLQHAVSEIRRVIRPDGRLYASTVGGKDLHELTAIIARFDRNSAIDVSATFSLENARDCLGAWFSTVNVHRYEDSLVVTEVDPLIAYMLSGCMATSALRAQEGELRDFLDAELAKRGSIRITKDVGMVEALP